MFFVAAYGGWAAVRREGPPVTEIGDPAKELQDSRALIDQSDALMQAMRDNDQRQVEQLKAERRARSRSEAEREDKRAVAVATARKWYGLSAAVSFVMGVWLLAAARKARPE